MKILFAIANKVKSPHVLVRICVWLSPSWAVLRGYEDAKANRIDRKITNQNCAAGCYQGGFMLSVAKAMHSVVLRSIFSRYEKASERQNVQ